MAQIGPAWGRTIFWLGTAGVAVAAALLLSPTRLLTGLDSQAEQFRADLAAGISLVRRGLLAVALLALASLALWRWPRQTKPKTTLQLLGRTDCLIALGLFVLASALALPNLFGSFWWDELTSLSLVVKRGPAVILAYSCKANNHILNSLGMWLSWHVAGAYEAAIRLPAFMLGTAIAPTIYLTLAGRWGRGRAAVAGSLAALHLGIASHTVEARGYSGAILCSFLACICFAWLLRSGAAFPTLAYITCSVAAIGFITTCVLVPIAHGSIAVCIALASPAPRRALGRNAVFACLWVAALSIVLFGLPLPQTWHYARTEAVRDHLPLGPQLLAASARYLTGSSSLPAALVLVALGIWGWMRSRDDLPFLLAFLAPVGAVLGWMLLPHASLSARFVCFLIPVTVLGLARALHGLARGGILPRAALIGAGLVWLSVTIAGQVRWQTLGNPDLKNLARHLRGSAVALLGPQADVNQYYFSKALHVGEPRELLSLPRVDCIIQGKMGEAVADERILALGFSLADQLDSAAPDRTKYLIYHRTQDEARRRP